MRGAPEAVVVDTATGHTISESLTHQPFTVEKAVEFAADCNRACKPKYRTYRAFELVPVGETKCTACGEPVGSVCWRCA